MIAKSILTRPALKLLKRLGPWGRRKAWDYEFKRGVSFSGERSPRLLSILRPLCRDKLVIELACGDGSLPAAGLGQRHYAGWDVSLEAVLQAKARNLPNADFYRDDMTRWTPYDCDVLVIEEAIYYLSTDERARLMRKVMDAAREHVVITVHDGDKHHEAIFHCASFAAGSLDFIREGKREYLIIRTRGEPSVI